MQQHGVVVQRCREHCVSRAEADTLDVDALLHQRLRVAEPILAVEQQADVVQGLRNGRMPFPEHLPANGDGLLVQISGLTEVVHSQQQACNGPPHNAGKDKDRPRFDNHQI